jgi:thiol-disulfide isomerase/thioredoxin
LFLEDANGVQLEMDDDGGGGLNSRIVYKAPKTALYRVVATTLVPGQTGKFALEFGTPSKTEVATVELLARANGFAALAVPQRKAFADEVRKHLQGLNGDLTVNDFRLVANLSEEAEIEGAIELARDVLEEGVKQFSAAKSEPVTKLTGPLENALKSLDKIGTKLEIAGMRTDGKEFDLARLKGKVVLVDFWGTWCPPCVAEIPNIHEAYKRFHAKGFEVIGVSSDKDDAVVIDFLESKKLPWGCINVEDSRKLIKTYEIRSYPSPMLVGTDGRIVSLRARGPLLDRLLERLLKEKK